MKTTAITLLVLWSLTTVFFAGRYSVRMYFTDKVLHTQTQLGCRPFWQSSSGGYARTDLKIYVASSSPKGELNLEINCY